jgi:type II secretory pathway pseudopilin PulG
VEWFLLVLSVLSTVVSIVAVLITRRAREDSRRSADAAEALVAIEQERQREASTPRFEVRIDFDEDIVPMLAVRNVGPQDCGPTTITIHETAGADKAIRFENGEQWLLPAIKVGDRPRARIKKDRRGGCVRIHFTCSLPDGGTRDVDQVFEVKPTIAHRILGI